MRKGSKMKNVIQVEFKEKFREFDVEERAILEKVKNSDGRLVQDDEVVFEWYIGKFGKHDVVICTASEFYKTCKVWVVDEKDADGYK